MVFSDCNQQDFSRTGISTGAYIIFDQIGPIEHGTYVQGPVAQSSTENKYNESCTTGISLAYFRMLIHELLDKDPDIVPEEAPLIILDSKSATCMDNNVKNTNNTRLIYRRLYLVRNGEK